MRSLFLGSLLLYGTGATQTEAFASGDSPIRPKLEVVFRADSLTVLAVNESVEDLDVFYPFALSYGGGGAGDLELVFRPVGRSPGVSEGQLCAAIQQAAMPKARVLWAGTLFGRRFDIPYVKAVFCLKEGAYDLVATLHLDGSLENKISSTATRVVIK